MIPIEVALLAGNLAEAKGLIETAEQRALAVDGPVSHVRDEMTDAEWTRLYDCITEAEAVMARTLVAARERFASHGRRRRRTEKST